MHHDSIIDLARRSGFVFTKDSATGLLQVSCDELELAYFVEYIISNERSEGAKAIRSREKAYLYPLRRESEDFDVSAYYNSPVKTLINRG